MTKEDFSVPKEFEKYCKELFAKKSITEREFVDLCLLAIKFSESDWDKRQGLACRIVGVWLKYENIDKNDQLDEIGGEFGHLELPDHHIGKDEAEVRQRWEAVKKLVHEADQAFPKNA